MADVTWSEQPLFGLALEGLALTASWRWESGWRVVVAVRHSGSDEWTSKRIYEGLTTDELPQLLEDVLAAERA